MKLIGHIDSGPNWGDKRELERAILRDERVHEMVVSPAVGLLSSVAVRPLRWFRNYFHLKGPIELPLRWLMGEDRDAISVLMGTSFRKVVPFVLPGRKYVYLFDAWPNAHDQIIAFLQEWGVQVCFLSIRAVVQDLTGKCPTCRFIWIPEAIDSSIYRPTPLAEKDLDVIIFGRKHIPYHMAVSSIIRDHGHTFIDDFIEPREAFIDHLGRAKISVCFPLSMTDPIRSGGVETMTMRYLQSIASKCLVVGHATADMLELFGYNPVIEADLDYPADQLLDLLEHIQDYEELIEKNYCVVLEHHQWSHRWQRMAEVLFPDR